MTIWDGAAGRKEAEAGAARSQEGFIDQQSGRSTEQVKLRTPSLGEKQVLQAGVTRRVLQVRYGGCDHSRKLNFLLGAGFELGKSTTARAWLFHPCRSDKVETAGLGLGGSRSPADLVFFMASDFQFPLKGYDYYSKYYLCLVFEMFVQPQRSPYLLISQH